MAKIKGVAKTTEPKEGELIILSPEQYELVVQESVTKEVAKLGLVESTIAEIKEKYSAIEVPKPGDKAGILLLKNALSDVTGIITRLEDKRVELKDFYLRTGQGIDAAAKKLKDLLLEIKDPLKEKKAEFDALEKAEKERKAKEEQEKLEARVAELKEAGLQFDGSFYSLGLISMDIVTIKQMKDSDYGFFIAKVKLEADRIQKVKEEEERIEREKKEEFERQQAVLKQQQDELAEQQRKMKEEREAFQRQQDELAEKQRELERQEEERKKQQLQDLIKKRMDILEALGFSYKASSALFVYKNEAGEHAVAGALLGTSSQEHFDEMVQDAKKMIGELDAAETEILNERKEQERLKAIEEEQDRQRKEQERKDQEEANRRAEEEKRLESMPDYEKAIAYFEALLAVKPPTVVNEKLYDVLSSISQDIQETATQLEQDFAALNTAGE